MAEQRQADRLKRLNDGRCPVHGLWMSQVDSWYEDELGGFTLVGCPRKDCDVIAKARSVDGPWSLVDTKAYLLEQGEDGSAEVLEFP